MLGCKAFFKAILLKKFAYIFLLLTASQLKSCLFAPELARQQLGYIAD